MGTPGKSERTTFSVFRYGNTYAVSFDVKRWESCNHGRDVKRHQNRQEWEEIRGRGLGGGTSTEEGIGGTEVDLHWGRGREAAAFPPLFPRSLEKI